MSFEIGPTPHARFAPPARRFAEAPAAEFSLDLARPTAPAAPAARVDTAELSIPASPPPEVVEAIGAAAARAEELAAAQRELHFRKDDTSNRIIIEVRDLEGNVIRTIPPSEALAVMSGAPV